MRPESVGNNLILSCASIINRHYVFLLNNLSIQKHNYEKFDYPSIQNIDDVMNTNKILPRIQQSCQTPNKTNKNKINVAWLYLFKSLNLFRALLYKYSRAFSCSI